MGDNYLIRLEVKLRNGCEKLAVDAIRKWILDTDGKGVDFGLNDKSDLHSFDGVMKIVFADDNSRVEIGWDLDKDGNVIEFTPCPVAKTIRENKNGFVKYTNGFSCSYGWQGVMWDAFDILAPFCEDGTTLMIDSDEGWLDRAVKDGIVYDVDKGSID